MFEDWFYPESEMCYDYELEHPSWQCEWADCMLTEFPAFVVDLGG